MSMLEELPRVRAFMRERRVDAWLVHDFRGSNAVMARLLPPPAGPNGASANRRFTTRRCALLITASDVAAPVLLHSVIDAPAFSDLPGKIRREPFLGWREYQAALAKLVGEAGARRVAMEYSPGCALPVVSNVDAGTVELVRSLGVEVASSADLVQVGVAVWSALAREAHADAARHTAEIMREAFAFLGERARGGAGVCERDGVEFIRRRFAAAGLEYPDGPIVAVNEHSGDPHYDPPERGSAPVKPGDWVMIDLWARRPGDENIYSDITWMGYVSRTPGEPAPGEQRAVFELVKEARDAAVARAQRAWDEGQTLRGFELDDAARAPIIAAGHQRHIKHRTGHSLSPGPMVHGLGMNLDNLETHDTREMLAGIGFTVEPGLYTPRFGCRLELNVYVDAERGPTVTSSVQNELLVV